MERLATTPFGGGRLTGRVLARQAKIGERQDQLRRGEGGNATGRVDKWQLLRALTESRQVYDLGDRTICLLEALVSFTSDRELDGSQPIIVFPSNRELSFRARGMAPATIRRHLACLVDAGMIFRRDSANGKRFCRRDDAGLVEDAFGFDLAPFALRAEEIYAAAEAARAEAKLARALRGEMTVLLRDISRIITLALEEGRAGDWEGYLVRYQVSFQGTVKRKHSTDLTNVVTEARAFRIDVENAYLSSLSDKELSGNDDDFEHHQQNSKTELITEYSALDKSDDEPVNVDKPNERKLAISLSKLNELCPQMNDYAKDGIRGWNDVVKTADLIRTMLGISFDAWSKAKHVMGDQAAAVTVAVMLEHGETIRSPGGYLRTLTVKAEAGKFSVYPMLLALDKPRNKPI
jgi:replication initiation protein RepC